MRVGLAACLLLAACERTSGRAGREPPPAAGSGREPPPAAGAAVTPADEVAGGARGRGLDPPSLLTARIRRLANAEYDATVEKLLSTRMRPAAAVGFPPDFRQGGFTVNDAQRIDTVLVERLAQAADALASEARASGLLARIARCG